MKLSIYPVEASN